MNVIESDRRKAIRTLTQAALAVLCLAVPVAASFIYLSLDVRRLLSLEALSGMLQFAGRFFPPDLSSAFLWKIAVGSLQTVAMSGVGTLLAAGVGLIAALPAGGAFGRPVKVLARGFLNFMRSVPELVWAALAVLAAGLGPFAGTLALAMHTSGVLGRLFAESLENAPSEPAKALSDKGAGSAVVFLYGTLPLVAPQLVAYSLYRWEMNIRMATVLGFVGAGGLGQMLYYELSLLHEAQACTVIMGMFALVVLVDSVSAWVRRRFVHAGG